MLILSKSEFFDSVYNVIDIDEWKMCKYRLVIVATL